MRTVLKVIFIVNRFNYFTDKYIAHKLKMTMKKNMMEMILIVMTETVASMIRETYLSV